MYCYSIFDTAIGSCGIVWNAGGVAGVQVHNGTNAPRVHP